MNDTLEWFHGVLESEFWTVYEGWRLFVRKSQFGGWVWSVQRGGCWRGSVADDRSAAENAAIKAVDHMEGKK